MTPTRGRQRPEKGSVRDSNSHDSNFTTAAQAEFRRGGARRLWWAGVVAVGALVAFVIFGPDEQDIKERFEYYGVQDEMRIMNEISIEDGQDRVAKIPKSLRVPPPPANLEVEDEDPDPDGDRPMPDPNDADPNLIDINTKNPRPDSEVSEKHQVEMALPVQASQSCFLIFAPQPEYPLQATEQERRTPVITVRMNLFVGPEGRVVEAMIESSNGNRYFEEAALNAVKEWKFGWRVAPGVGRWIKFPFRFNSPYFSPDR